MDTSKLTEKMYKAMTSNNIGVVKDLSDEFAEQFDLYYFTTQNVTSVDNGFIAGCIEMGELMLALNFLKNVYKMSLTDSIIHVIKVLRKEVTIV